MTDTASIQIRPGIYYAGVQDEGVLLDLWENRYIGLGKTSARLWEALASGTPAERLADSLHARVRQQVIDEQLRIWRERGFLVDGARPDLDAVLPTRRAALPGERAELDRAAVDATRLSPGALRRMTAASLWWHVRGARMPVRAALRHLQGLPAKPGVAWRELTLETLRAYNTLRLPFRQGSLDCLPRSLLLTYALRQQGVDAVVRFSVKKFPFNAHAWVEVESTVCNDLLEKALGFSTIAYF